MFEISILIVEDDETISAYLQKSLKNLAKTIFVAKNGKDGLEKFKQNKIDIVVTDLNMPLLNGIEMSKEIRRFDAKVPIIILTAYHEEELIMEAINDGGVNKYLLKPINMKKLKEIINEFTKNIKKNTKLSDILSPAEKASLLEGFDEI
jgi:YesN/AraC family two-component response regulator